MNLKVDNSTAMIVLQIDWRYLHFFTNSQIVHKIKNFLMGTHCGKLVMHSEILGYEGLGFWREDNL